MSRVKIRSGSKLWEQVTEFSKPVSNIAVVPRERSYLWGLFKKNDGYLVATVDTALYKYVDPKTPPKQEVEVYCRNPKCPKYNKVIYRKET